MNLANVHLREKYNAIESHQFLSSDDKYKILCNLSNSGIIISSLEGEIIEYNQSFLKLLGYENDQLVNTNIQDLYFDSNELQNICDLLSDINILSNYKLKFITKEKRIIFANVSVTLFNDSNKTYLFSVVQDISEQNFKEIIKNVHDRLWNLSPDLEIDGVLDSTIYETCKAVESPIGHFQCTMNTLFESWSISSNSNINKTKLSSTKYLIAKTDIWADCLREQKPIIFNDYLTLEKEKDLTEDILEIKRIVLIPVIKDKTTVAIISLINKLTDYDERDVRIVQAISEISLRIIEKKRYEVNQLKQAEVIKFIDVGIIITNTHGIIEYANPSLLKKSGYSMNELIGKSTKIFKSGNHNQEFYKTLWETILSGKTWRGEIYNKNKNGKCVWEYAAISPIMNNKGDIVNFVSIKDDITKTKNLLKELSEAKIKSEKADKFKSEFLTQISHEIRTPINTLLSFASLIRADLSEQLSPDLQDSFYHMENAGNRIIRTVDLLIKLSEIYTDNNDLIFKENDLIALLDNVINFYKPAAELKNIELKYQVFVEAGNIVFDYQTIYDVFSNLIDNAVKFTDTGKVIVQVKKIITNNLAVSVVDTGVGISSHYIKNIFNLFSQETNGYTRKYDGNGLGLSLVKEYCKLNNAEIFVSSEKGNGSDFTVLFK